MNKGISLIEVLVAQLVVSISLLGSGYVLGQSQSWQAQSRWRQETSFMSDAIQASLRRGYKPDLDFWQKKLYKAFPESSLTMDCQENQCLITLTPKASLINLKKVSFKVIL